MKVEYKFNPNDKVYYIDLHSTPVEGKCPFCLGYGEFIRQGDGALIKCKECKGTGKIPVGHDTKYWTLIAYVDEVRIFVDRHGVIISYDLTEYKDGGGISKSRKESDLFDNFEDAIKECEQLNNKGASGSRGAYGTT